MAPFPDAGSADISILSPGDSFSKRHVSQFDRLRKKLAKQDDNEGWESELRRYLKDLPANVTKDTNILVWWSVGPHTFFHLLLLINSVQENAKLYPTLARIALDILACQASSVPCERLFSSAKLIATDKRSRLSAERFEQLQILKFVWRSSIIDRATDNSNEIEEISEGDLQEFRDILANDDDILEWEKQGILWV